MITNSEEANKYYQLVNQYIDDYTEKWKVRPSNLSKYLLKNNKLIKFLERNGLTDIKNVDRVIKDILDDRIALEKDLVMKFENFKFFESADFTILDVKRCLYRGIHSPTIDHEKILADYFDVSLSHINIVNADNHLFRIESNTSDIECIVYTESEVEIIQENLKEYCLNQVFNKKVKLDGIGVDLNVNIKDFIDTKKFMIHLAAELSEPVIKEVIASLIGCTRGKYNPDEKHNFIGINPSN